MPGFFLALNNVAADVGPAQLPNTYMVANSETIYSCDPVVWTSVTGSQNRVRRLVQDDIDDNYTVGSIAGVLGFNPAALATSSSGAMTAVPSPMALAPNVAPIYPVPDLAGFEPQDPVSGRLETSVFSCLNNVSGNLWESTTVTQSLIGTAVGLLISTLSGAAPTYFWSTGASVKIGRIVSVDVQNPLFNTTVSANVQDTTHNPRAVVTVLLYSTYDQFLTNIAYDD